MTSSVKTDIMESTALHTSTYAFDEVHIEPWRSIRDNVWIPTLEATQRVAVRPWERLDGLW